MMAPEARDDHPSDVAGEQPPSPPASRSFRRLFAMLVLLGEALVVGFATLVAKDLADVSRGTALLAGGLLALLCIVTAGLLRSRVGYSVGWAVQVLLLASAIWVPVMLFLGLVFGGLWVMAMVQGQKADDLTARRAAAERHPGGPGR
ncbi:MAG TPA: DUF4233 domain-containing protein [Actinomycetales bacterium]|nr:DUF4233 domain-containing protein [Actinomycetales bacterium]